VMIVYLKRSVRARRRNKRGICSLRVQTVGEYRRDEEINGNALLRDYRIYVGTVWGVGMGC
jgi:hypothetical protein